MQAVILAAGTGSRLNELTRRCPKSMLEVAGRTLIRRTLDGIAWAGMREAVIVTGYLAEMLRAHVGDRHGALRVRYRHNRDYDRTGSMMSLLAAVPDLDSHVFAIFESDLLFHREFARAAASATTTTLFAAGLSGSGDEVYVGSDTAGRLLYLGKSVSPDQITASDGEFAGITAMSQDFLARYRQTCQTLMRGGERGLHYEEVILQTAQAGVPVEVRNGGDLAWTEVDTEADLARARTDVWPRLVAADGVPPAAEQPAL